MQLRAATKQTNPNFVRVIRQEFQSSARLGSGCHKPFYRHMFVLSYMYFTFWNFRHRLVRLYWYILVWIMWQRNMRWTNSTVIVSILKGGSQKGVFLHVFYVLKNKPRVVSSLESNKYQQPFSKPHDWQCFTFHPNSICTNANFKGDTGWYRYIWKSPSTNQPCLGILVNA